MLLILYLNTFLKRIVFVGLFETKVIICTIISIAF